ISWRNLIFGVHFECRRVRVSKLDHHRRSGICKDVFSKMEEVPKLLYSEKLTKKKNQKEGKTTDNLFRYTRVVLQSTLQLMGCKAGHASK
ncbi:hypothetical protein MKX03_024647, partial [Papaver bracteatum]